MARPTGDPVMMRVFADQFAAFIAYNRVNLAVRDFCESYSDGIPPAQLVEEVMDAAKRSSALIRNCLSSTQQLLRSGGLPPHVEDDLDILRDWCIQTGDIVSEIDAMMRGIVLTDEDYAGFLRSYLSWYYDRTGVDLSASADDGSDEDSDDAWEEDASDGDVSEDAADDGSVEDPGDADAPDDDAASEDGYEVIEPETLPEDGDAGEDPDADPDAPIIEEGSEYAADEPPEVPSPAMDGSLLEQIVRRMDAMQAENDRIARDYGALREENDALMADNRELASRLEALGRGETLRIGAQNAYASLEQADVPSILTDAPDPEPVVEAPSDTSYASSVPDEPAPKRRVLRKKAKAGSKRKAAPAKKRFRSKKEKADADEASESSPETPSQTGFDDEV